MATCSAYAINYFVNVNGQADLAVLGNRPTDSPFRPSFAPEATFTLANNMITTDSYNTIGFRESVYSLNDIQICTPTVKRVENQTSMSNKGRGIYAKDGIHADLLLTFINYTRRPNEPETIIIIMPIYTTLDKNPNILSDIIQQKTTVHSLIDLFDEESFSYGYNACITTVVGKDNVTIKDSISAYIISFPKGFKIPQADINQLTNLPAYTFYPAKGDPIVTAFSFNSNTDTYTPMQNLLDSTTFYTKNESANSDKIKNNIVHYTRSPSHTFGKTSAQYKLDQYKCYPFSELRNLQTDPSGSKYVIPMEEAVTELKKSSPDGSVNFSTIIYSILGILGLFAIIGVIYVIFSYYTTQDQIPIEDMPREPPAFPTPD